MRFIRFVKGHGNVRNLVRSLTPHPYIENEPMLRERPGTAESSDIAEVSSRRKSQPVSILLAGAQRHG